MARALHLSQTSHAATAPRDSARPTTDPPKAMPPNVHVHLDERVVGGFFCHSSPGELS
jgi:hypothetical protein